MERRSETLIPNYIRRLLSENSLQIDSSSTNEDLTCNLCKNIMLNAYQASCGCHYCYRCISENLERGGKYCYGTKDKCQKEALLLDGPNANILRSPQLNKKIMTAKVICPNEWCIHRTELSTMGDHLRVCLKQRMKCSVNPIGCHDDTPSNETKEVNISTETFRHTQSLIKSIDNLKKDIELLREDYKVKKISYFWIGAIFLAFMTVIAASLYFMTLNQYSDKKVGELETYGQEVYAETRLHEKMFTESTSTDKQKEEEKLFENQYPEKKFILDNLSELKKEKRCVLSPEFYSHIEGYKLEIVVCSQFNVSSLSVYMRICKGKYDDMLTWPCDYYFVLGLVNQIYGQKYKSVPISYERSKNKIKNFFQRPELNCNDPYGYEDFVTYEVMQSTVGIIVNDSIVITLISNRPPN